jgi:lipid A ethanolaminephosphotransferase
MFSQFNFIQRSTLHYLWFVAIFIHFFYNSPFLSYCISHHISLFFYFILSFANIAIIQWLLSLLIIRPSIRLPIFILCCLSSLLFYAYQAYRVLIDVDMIQNIMDTNSRESFSYFNLSLVMNFILFGMIPGFILYQIKTPPERFYTQTCLRIISFTLSICIAIGLVLNQYKLVSSTFRNHHGIEKHLIPTAAIISLGIYTYEKLHAKTLTYQPLGEDAKQTPAHTPQTIVLVIGETARAQNYPYMGYLRNTTPFTTPFHPIYLKNVQSCGTATAVSLPCMFSFLKRNNYDKFKAVAEDNLLDVVMRAGIDITWIDNNTGCKGVCDKVNPVFINPNTIQGCDGNGHCFDDNLLRELTTALLKPSSKDKLIILHLLGSHGPDYYQRYPSQFSRFKPECLTNHLQSCSRQSLINTYDNTLYYTDYLLAQIIHRLISIKSPSSLIYLSDHGESLGEHGLYLHGTPYFMAPRTQTTIPWFFWFSPSFKINHHNEYITLKKLETKQDSQLSHDNLVHSLLHLLSIKTNIYDKRLDIFSHKEQ